MQSTAHTFVQALRRCKGSIIIRKLAEEDRKVLSFPLISLSIFYGIPLGLTLLKQWPRQRKLKMNQRKYTWTGNMLKQLIFHLMKKS